MRARQAWSTDVRHVDDEVMRWQVSPDVAKCTYGAKTDSAATNTLRVHNNICAQHSTPEQHSTLVLMHQAP